MCPLPRHDRTVSVRAFPASMLKKEATRRPPAHKKARTPILLLTRLGSRRQASPKFRRQTYHPIGPFLPRTIQPHLMFVSPRRSAAATTHENTHSRPTAAAATLRHCHPLRRAAPTIPSTTIMEAERALVQRAGLVSRYAPTERTKAL